MSNPNEAASQYGTIHHRVSFYDMFVADWYFFSEFSTDSPVTVSNLSMIACHDNIECATRFKIFLDYFYISPLTGLAHSHFIEDFLEYCNVYDEILLADPGNLDLPSTFFVGVLKETVLLL